MTRRPMAAPWESDPILDLTRGKKWRLVAAYAIAFVVICGFIVLMSLAGS